jgi:hypothetical protein
LRFLERDRCLIYTDVEEQVVKFSREVRPLRGNSYNPAPSIVADWDNDEPHHSAAKRVRNRRRGIESGGCQPGRECVADVVRSVSRDQPSVGMSDLNRDSTGCSLQANVADIQA